MKKLTAILKYCRLDTCIVVVSTLYGMLFGENKLRCPRCKERTMLPKGRGFWKSPLYNCCKCTQSYQVRGGVWAHAFPGVLLGLVFGVELVVLTALSLGALLILRCIIEFDLQEWHILSLVSLGIFINTFFFPRFIVRVLEFASDFEPVHESTEE